MKVTQSTYRCDSCGRTEGFNAFPLGWYRVNSLSRGNTPHVGELHLLEHLDFCGYCAYMLFRHLDLLEIKYNHRFPQTDLTKPIEPGNILVME